MLEIVLLVVSLIILVETSFLFFNHFRACKVRNKRGRRRIFIDTSILMDGRILDIAETGFIGDDLIIPKSVIRELQLLADGRDNEKRERARRGLDVVNALERVVHFDTTILSDKLDRTPVDERLLDLARSERGIILTLDYNLMKVAGTEHIKTLNLNDLVMSLAHKHLPGEKLTLRIIGLGSNENQGIAYTEDGIMVVVDKAKDKVGKTIDVELTRFAQTSAGRMLFAKIIKSSSKVSSSKA